LVSLPSLHPPSFPTRRSSDLELIFFECPDFPCHGQKIEQTVKLISQVCKSVCDPVKQRADALITYEDKKQRPQTKNKSDFVGELDRKSTRLNSSHVSISYAVF